MHVSHVSLMYTVKLLRRRLCHLICVTVLLNGVTVLYCFVRPFLSAQLLFVLALLTDRIKHGPQAYHPMARRKDS